MMEKFRWLAAVVAAHPEHKVVGRTRLQKTVKLLQRLGAPLDYDYTIHFYGPYSEGVQADIGLLENCRDTCPRPRPRSIKKPAVMNQIWPLGGGGPGSPSGPICIGDIAVTGVFLTKTGRNRKLNIAATDVHIFVIEVCG